jgi:hypothetical protein
VLELVGHGHVQRAEHVTIGIIVGREPDEVRVQHDLGASAAVARGVTVGLLRFELDPVLVVGSAREQRSGVPEIVDLLAPRILAGDAGLLDVVGNSVGGTDIGRRNSIGARHVVFDVEVSRLIDRKGDVRVRSTHRVRVVQPARLGIETRPLCRDLMEDQRGAAHRTRRLAVLPLRVQLLAIEDVEQLLPRRFRNAEPPRGPASSMRASPAPSTEVWARAGTASAM